MPVNDALATSAGRKERAMYAEMIATHGANTLHRRGLRTAALAALRAVWRGYEATAPALITTYLGTGFDWPLWTAPGCRVSAGRATGRARLVANEADAEALEDGEVLVLRDAAPGALACLPRASAVVLASGGELCAAARLARERGLPAVGGLREAAAAIETGDWLTVDGDRGTVQVTARWQR